MRLTDEMVELDDRKYRDRNVLVELKYMGREIKHRKTVTNDDLRFMAWLYRSALNLLKEQESVIEALKSDLDETLAVLGEQAEIVRCADCKYCVKEPSGELYCDILAVGYEPLGSKKVNGDWYCADGERR